MDITVFLAHLWGPTLFAVAIGVLLNRSYYIRIYRDLEKNSLAVLVFGMVAMMAGLAHIYFHSIWHGMPQIIVSFLGWGLLVKGVLFLVAPNFVDKAGDGWADLKLIPIAGGLMLLIGGYLTWLAYMV